MTKKLEELFDVAPTNEIDITAEENSTVVEAVTADERHPSNTNST